MKAMYESFYTSIQVFEDPRTEACREIAEFLIGVPNIHS
jgi:hypothetical protein